MNKTQTAKALAEAIETLAEVIDARQALNERLQTVLDTLENAASERESYEGDRSDKWHESDAGQAYVEATGAIASAKDDLAGILNDEDPLESIKVELENVSADLEGGE